MFAALRLRAQSLARPALAAAAGVGLSASGLTYALAEAAPASSKLVPRKTERVGDAVTVLPEDGLSPGAWTALKLESVTPLTHNTAIYRFALADKRSPSGLTVASCLLTKAAIGSEKPDGSRGVVIRPYTPVSRPEARGYVDLAIKTYPDGKMSQHMASLKVFDRKIRPTLSSQSSIRQNQMQSSLPGGIGSGVSVILTYRSDSHCQDCRLGSSRLAHDKHIHPQSFCPPSLATVAQ